MDAKRSLSKIARTVLTKDYKCISLNRKRGLDLEPSKWDPKENKILAEKMLNSLMKEVKVVAGNNTWNPSFYPVGVFRDPDNLIYKLLNDEDRKGYMIDVIQRNLLATESKEE